MNIFRLFFVSLVTILMICEKVVSQPIIPCQINNRANHKGTVAACMMFQNEGRFLTEWLEYHKSIGVTHFYLYNNASSDNFWQILMPYVISGQVELFDLYEKTSNCQEHNDLQRQVYGHAVNLAKNNFKWLAIIDSDEFICMPHDNNLGKFLESYLYGTGVVINWVMYGSSGIEELGPNDLQIEKFVYRVPDNWHENFMFKTIVRPEYVLRADIHVCDCHPNMLVHASHQKFSHHPQFVSPPIENIRINHYAWRDEKYFREVKRPRHIGWLCNHSDAAIDSQRKIYNSVYDPSMLPFVEATRRGCLKGP